MSNRFLPFALLFMLILAAAPAAAQFEPPLIVAYGDQLWTTDGSNTRLIPFETCPTSMNEPLVFHQDGFLALSPDSTMLAYNIQPAFVTETLARVGAIGGGELPSNIVLCDLQTGSINTIAGQPSDAVFDEAGNIDNITMHSLPAWSPDGSQLAWTQFSYPDVDNGGLAVMLHDLNGGETVQIAQIPPQFGVPVTIPLQWSEGGILVRNQTFVPLPEGADPMTSPPPVSDTLQVLDPSRGTLQTIHTFSYEGLDAPYPQDYFWVNTASGWQVALLNSINEWQIIDPSTGTAAPREGTLAYGIPGSRTAALITQDLGGMFYQWLDISDPPLYPAALGYETTGRITPPAISLPPSAVYAFHDAEGAAIVIWADAGSENHLPLPAVNNPFGGVQAVWGGGAEWNLIPPQNAPGMNLFYPALPLMLSPAGCPGFMPSQLIVGEMGSVIDDQANNVRSAPTRSGELIGQIPAGGRFVVVAGPVCADELAWWRVDYNGLVGWTAEGIGSEYWLAPVGAG